MDQEELNNLVAYYANLLIIQYNEQPNAKAQIELFVRELLTDGLITTVRDSFDIDTAVGKQLDTVAKYVYLDRAYSFLDLQGYFSLTDYTESPISIEKIGFATYADFDSKVGETLTYADVIAQALQLTNDSFRQLIKLRIIQNNSNNSHKSIDDGIYTFFGDLITVAQTGTMEITYTIPPSLKQFIEAAIQKDALPRPIGVKLNYTIA